MWWKTALAFTGLFASALAWVGTDGADYYLGDNRNEVIRGMGGDLSELMEQLNQLQPKQGDMYSLSVQATADCN